MEPGVWHAGPMFIVSSSASLKLSSHVKQDANYMDFLSLELSDTNIVDHNTHVYTREGITFSVQLEWRWYKKYMLQDFHLKSGEDCKGALYHAHFLTLNVYLEDGSLPIEHNAKVLSLLAMLTVYDVSQCQQF